MKLNGTPIQRPDPVTIELYRNSGTIKLQAVAVFDYTEFDRVYPEPPVPTVRKVGQQEAQPNPNDPSYQKKLEQLSRKKTEWTIHKSLTEGTPGLVFEKFDPEDPETWNVRKELSSVFTQAEVATIVHKVIGANSPGKDTYADALENFPQSQAAEVSPATSQTDGPENTTSGESAKDSV